MSSVNRRIAHSALNGVNESTVNAMVSSYSAMGEVNVMTEQ